MAHARWPATCGVKATRLGRKRIRRLMATMGLEPIYQRPRTTVPHPEHQIYPYLLREMVIERPNPVWCADITYIPMRRGFLYLVAVGGWGRREGGAPRGPATTGAGLFLCAAGVGGRAVGGTH